MQQTPDDNGQPIPVAPVDTDSAYHQAPDGLTAIALPAGARFLELTAAGTDVWFRFGTVSVTAVAETANKATGSSRFLPAGASILVDISQGGATHVALKSTGGIVRSWWA